jgi:hypothetical protein
LFYRHEPYLDCLQRVVRTLAEKIETITSRVVLTRYPSHGDTPPPTMGEIADALRLVKQLRALAAKAAPG